jgi:cytochrome P450
MKLRSIREEEAINLVRRIASNAGSVFNLSKAIFSLTNTITARSALGKKNEQQEEVELLMDQVFKALGGFSTADMYPRAKLLHFILGARRSIEKTHRELDKILQNIIVDHKTKNETREEDFDEDLVDVLLRIQKNGDLEFPVTDDCVKTVILDIFSAGSDTSSTAVEWAMSEMLKDRRVMEKAQAEVRKVFDERRNVDETGLSQLKYLQCVIKETLRLHPPAPLLVPRQNSKQCEISGYMIPPETKVIVNAWAIGRDPKYWGAEAELFKPERFVDSPIDYNGNNFTYIPFGAGRRICPGISFAAVNMELPLAQLLYHFDWKLPTQEHLDMTEQFGLTVRRKYGLNLVPVPYHLSLVQTESNS